MVRKRDDVAVVDTPLTEEQVAAFLRRHPDFLVRHPDLLMSLAPPTRFHEDSGVIDLQAFMIAHQREELARIKGAAEHLIHTSRSNMSTQNRTHQAALVLLAADSMDALVQAIADDLPGILDVDAATLRIEESGKPLPALASVGRVPKGAVEKILGGNDRDCALSQELPGDPALFGEAASLVKSSAVVRVSPGGKCPEGVLSLGSRHGRTFYSGQGTDLLGFLARVLQSCVHRFVG
ncbi:MAG TPA: DUF484 family protein [Candidatus Omnitrophota bacterium]|nr:DUF484 family protein [Candidatus Omnitrophota bacterium]